jgi:hypothetical protein
VAVAVAKFVEAPRALCGVCAAGGDSFSLEDEISSWSRLVARTVFVGKTASAECQLLLVSSHTSGPCLVERWECGAVPL